MEQINKNMQKGERWRTSDSNAAKVAVGVGGTVVAFKKLLRPILALHSHWERAVGHCGAARVEV